MKTITLPIAIGVSLMLGGLVIAVWQAWRHQLPYVFLRGKAVEADALALIAQYGENADIIARRNEFEAWKHGDDLEQAKWHRVERAVVRLQRKR